LLRRVYLDLVGLPPTPPEQEAFLRDASPDAYEKVVDRLLASPQHGARYARHWLDVLRYADRDEHMLAAPGIHLWRDWVIRALNDDLPYDAFARAQLTGYRSAERTTLSATGVRARAEPRPEDVFALGFLARGAVGQGPLECHELALAAAETVSTAFLGLSAGCAKCHDHMYDPITQRDFYALKALFDPLVPRKLTLAAPADLFARGRAVAAAEEQRRALERRVDALAGPYRRRLYEERVALLPPDVQAVVRKPAAERTAAEQRAADDYFPVLRIDPEKVAAALPAGQREAFRELQRRLAEAAAGPPGPELPAFWTVEVDPLRAAQKSYVLTSGDPARPELHHAVEPGWPFAPLRIDFRDGRVEAFADWLTAPTNPLFARVAANRLWQWHFGEGLHRSPSDFGKLGGAPSNRPLLDWLAAEFARQGFRMKALHRLIVTSAAYRRASEVEPTLAAANGRADPDDTYLWRYPLRRLDAEALWDSVWSAAGALDMSVGGPSFDPARAPPRPAGGDPPAPRRAVYLVRGYAADRDVTPHFLRAFDVDDGRTPCPLRTRTVTAPQALLLMNGDVAGRGAARLAERLRQVAGGPREAVDLGYRLALARPPSAQERDAALAYLGDDPGRLGGLAWLLLNLDEFAYAR
jgi:hypothetical protein